MSCGGATGATTGALPSSHRAPSFVLKSLWDQLWNSALHCGQFCSCKSLHSQQLSAHSEFSVYLLTWLARYRTDLPSSVGQPFSTADFSRHCFGLIPASCSFAASAFPVPPIHQWVPSYKAAARFGSSSSRFWLPQKKWAEKGDIFMSYLVMIVGFVGADPEQRQARNNGPKTSFSHCATVEIRQPSL